MPLRPKMRGDFSVKSNYANLPESRVRELLAMIGAADPVRGARSQTDEQINQLGRSLVHRCGWECVFQEGDYARLNAMARCNDAHPQSPFSGTGLAVREMLDKGVSHDFIIELIRMAQAEAITYFLMTLDDPSHCEEFDDVPELADLCFEVWQIDHETESLEGRAGSLHEGFVTADPSGRQCCPHPDMLS